LAESRGFQSALRELASEFAFELDDPIVERLTAHFDLLLTWNRRMNLTRITDPHEAARFHYLESIAGAKLLVPGRDAVIDVGSGAGFPGLPIASLDPTWRVRLVESNGRRAVFLKEAARAMNLSRVVVINERFDPRIVGAEDIVVARAVDRFEVLLPELFRSPARQVVLWGERGLLERAERVAGGRVRETIVIPGSRERLIAGFAGSVPRETGKSPS
jgi:16S rRNA (guanine(527)-N(7))-methyltransferase RsmG